MSCQLILVINTGSSSLKMGLYDVAGNTETLVLNGEVDGIGQDRGSLILQGPKADLLQQSEILKPTQASAFHHICDAIKTIRPDRPRAIGHRVVHGGPRLTAHQLITDDVLQILKASVYFAPLHIPAAVELIDEAQRAFPDLPHFACFDTAFHSALPERVARFPLPQQYFEEGVRRFGFHGLSYESIVHQLGEEIPSHAVIAHLGSGASLAALSDGRSIDTSMGLTPTGGIPMATRCGDIDPGVLLYLIRAHGMNADQLETLLNHESGLKALSNGLEQMERIEAAADAGQSDDHLAFEMFCLSVAKTIAAYSISLEGLDLLVFTGGIGEHSAAVRARVCSLLRVLRVELQPARNAAGARSISADSSKVKVAVLPSQEDLQIARHCRNLLARK